MCSSLFLYSQSKFDHSALYLPQSDLNLILKQFIVGSIKIWVQVSFMTGTVINILRVYFFYEQTFPLLTLLPCLTIIIGNPELSWLFIFKK
jgi:hypothetical protein